jgi:hypothetical protein
VLVGVWALDVPVGLDGRVAAAAYVGVHAALAAIFALALAQRPGASAARVSSFRAKLLLAPLLAAAAALLLTEMAGPYQPAVGWAAAVLIAAWDASLMLDLATVAVGAVDTAAYALPWAPFCLCAARGSTCLCAPRE